MYELQCLMETALMLELMKIVLMLEQVGKWDSERDKLLLWHSFNFFLKIPSIQKKRSS